MAHTRSSECRANTNATATANRGDEAIRPSGDESNPCADHRSDRSFPLPDNATRTPTLPPDAHLCTAHDLHGSFGDAQAGTGNLFFYTVYRNISGAPCWVRNPPVVILLDTTAQPIPLMSVSPEQRPIQQPGLIQIQPYHRIILPFRWAESCTDIPGGVVARVMLSPTDWIDTPTFMDGSARCDPDHPGVGAAITNDMFEPEDD